MKRSKSQFFYSGFLSIAVVVLASQGTGAENFEFPLTNPMLITSLRTFDKISDNFHIFRSRNGSIILRADPGYGIMAVVQEMNLQDIHQEYSTTPTCLDYIKLSQVEGSGEGTKEICGNLEHQAAGNAERPSFMDPTGFLELDYVLKEKSRISPLERNITNFNISFTPFRECPEDAFPFGSDSLRPCSVLHTFSCISADFFCDGVINCAFPHEFGLDEQNCPPPKSSPQEQQVQSESEQSNDEPLPTLDIGNKGEEEEVDVEELENQLRIRIFHYGRQANAGIFATITIFVILLGLIKMRRSRDGSRRLFVQQSDHADDSDFERMPTNKSGGLMEGEELMYDPEGDPVPSYEDCLLLDMDSSRPVYSMLSIDHERPPSYEEVRVHSWTQRLRI